MRGVRLALAGACIVLTAASAHAGTCSNPTGPEGQMIYNKDYKTMQFCNGTDWVAMGGVWNVPWEINGTSVHYDGGNVGIGTSSPGATLEVVGTTILEQQAWQTPTFQNSWADYGSGYSALGYFKDSQGIVHIRGVVAGGSCGYAVFTLPAGYRPGYRTIRTGRAHNGSISFSTRTDVLTNGQVVAGGYVGGPVCGTVFYSLDGISFRAEN